MGSNHNSNNMEKTKPLAHGPNHEHLSRKQKRQLLNKVGDLTMNADDMMKEYNTMEETEEDAAQQTTIKMEGCTGIKIQYIQLHEQHKPP
jgi:hypothetical protein